MEAINGITCYERWVKKQWVIAGSIHQSEEIAID